MTGPTSPVGSISERSPVCVSTTRVSRYDSPHVDIFESARKHGVRDDDILHAIDFAVVAAEEDDGKVLYLGPDTAGNLLEVVAWFARTTPRSSSMP